MSDTARATLAAAVLAADRVLAAPLDLPVGELRRRVAAWQAARDAAMPHVDPDETP